MKKLLTLIFVHLVHIQYSQALKCFVCAHTTGVVDEYGNDASCETSNPNNIYLVDCEHYIMSKRQKQNQRFFKQVYINNTQGNNSTESVTRNRQQGNVYACGKGSIKGQTDDTDMEMIDRFCVVFDLKNAINTDKCTSGKIADIAEVFSFWGATARAFLSTWGYGEIPGSTHFSGCLCSTDGCNSVVQIKVSMGLFGTVLIYWIVKFKGNNNL